MRRRTAEALLLDVVDLQERDRIVSLLTREYGQIRGVARGARRKYSRFAGQLQPLCKVRVTWFEKDGRDLVRIEDVQVERTAQHLYGELEGILTGSYLAETMRVFAQENEESEHLFRLLDTVLEEVRGGLDPDLATRYYEAWILRLAGLFPPPGECAGCGAELERKVFLPTAGEALVCGDCIEGMGGGRGVSPGALRFLRRIGRQGPREMAEDPTASAILREVERICAQVRRHFLGHELRSYDVMQRTLSEVPGPVVGSP